MEKNAFRNVQKLNCQNELMNASKKSREHPNFPYFSFENVIQNRK